MHAHAHGIGSRFEYRHDFLIAHFFPKAINGCFDGRGVVCKIIVNRDPIYYAFDFHPSFDIFKRFQRFYCITCLYASMVSCGDSHQCIVHIVLADQRPFYFAHGFVIVLHNKLATVRFQRLGLPSRLLGVADKLLFTPATFFEHRIDIDIGSAR